MKLFGYLLMTLGLALGTLFTTTAYVPKLGPALAGLTLNAPAGIALLPNASLLEVAKRRPEAAPLALASLRGKRGPAVIRYAVAFGTAPPAAAEPGEGRILVASREGVSAAGIAPIGNHQLYLVTDGIAKGELTAIETKLRAPADPKDPTSLPRELGPVAIDAGHHRMTIGLGTDVSDAAMSSLENAGTAASLVSTIGLDDGSLAKAALEPTSGKVFLPAAPASAGAPPAKPKYVPLAHARDVLSEALIAGIDAGGEQRVRVKSFALARWQWSWAAGLAALAILAGALLVRRQTKLDIAARAAAAVAGEQSPAAAMARIRASVARLAPVLADNPTEDDLDRVVTEIGELQNNEIEAILEARADLIGRLSLGGFAEFMDRFSAMERQINRAWSAAADGAVAEARDALRAVPELAQEAEAKLG